VIDFLSGVGTDNIERELQTKTPCEKHRRFLFAHPERLIRAFHGAHPFGASSLRYEVQNGYPAVLSNSTEFGSKS